MLRALKLGLVSSVLVASSGCCFLFPEFCSLPFGDESGLQEGFEPGIGGIDNDPVAVLGGVTTQRVFVDGRELLEVLDADGNSRGFLTLDGIELVEVDDDAVIERPLNLDEDENEETEPPTISDEDAGALIETLDRLGGVRVEERVIDGETVFEAFDADGNSVGFIDANGNEILFIEEDEDEPEDTGVETEDTGNEDEQDDAAGDEDDAADDDFDDEPAGTLGEVVLDCPYELDPDLTLPLDDGCDPLGSGFVFSCDFDLPPGAKFQIEIKASNPDSRPNVLLNKNGATPDAGTLFCGRNGQSNEITDRDSIAADESGSFFVALSEGGARSDSYSIKITLIND